MVLENFIRKAMEKYLSDILEGVDHQAISLQLVKGEVTLDDVSIKPSFLKQLALPFPFPLAFHRATIGHLQLGVNWNQLLSQPLLIKVSKIHLWAEAKAYDALVGVESAYVIHSLAKAIQDKLDQLNREEEIRLAIAEYGEGEGPKKPSVILARLIALVTTTLQLEVNDVHICISIPGIEEHPGLHMGLAVEQIKFETTDADWKVTPIHFLTGPTYKSITVQNLSIYLNPDPRADELAKDKQNKNQKMIKEELKEMSALPPESLPSPEIATAAEVARSLHGNHNVTEDESHAPYQFILKPTSLGINLTFNKNLIPAVEVHAIIDLAALQLTITRPQLLTLLHLKDVVSVRHDQVKKWIESQPAHPPITDFQQKRYMYLYKRTLNALWLPELTEDEIKEKEMIEREFPYEEISLMRHASVLELKKELGSHETVSDRQEAIDKRTHWWDKLFRSEEGIKARIEDKASPQHQLSEGQKQQILQHVRGEETVPEREVEEEDAFSMDDLMAMLTFHLSVELNVGEIGLELWSERTEEDMKAEQEKNKEGPTDLPDPRNENLIAVAAREQRKRDDKAAIEGVRSKPRVPSVYGKEVDPNENASHYEGESMADIHLRPYLRLQINKISISVELEKEGDAKLDGTIDTIQFFDLSLCNAHDPWTAVHHPNNELVEFGYVGPIIPTSSQLKGVVHSVQRDIRPGPTSNSQSIAPSSMPQAIIIRMRRSPEVMNSDQRTARAQVRAQQQPEHGGRDISVTDILFGSDPDEDKSRESASGTKKQSDASKSDSDLGGYNHMISPPIMFASTVPVRTVADVHVNNFRLSFTDSLIELPDFIRSPPAPYSKGEKEEMEKGENVLVIDSAQKSSDNQEERTGGEHKPTKQSIEMMKNPEIREEHQAEISELGVAPVRGELTNAAAQSEAEKNKAKNKEKRLEKEKEAVEKSVQVVQGDPHQEPQRSAAGQAGTEVEKSASSSSSSSPASESPASKPKNSLQFLSWFSPLLFRAHIPSPFISLIPDTSAKQLTRLTFSVNANARALLDGEKDAIHARADLSNVRAWVARTKPVQAISLATFNPPTEDDHYIIKPFNIAASFQRFPSPIQQLLNSTKEQQEQVDIEREFNKEVGSSVDNGELLLTGDDVDRVFGADDGIHHMEADVDISSIHIKLAAKLWYMLQPFLNRIKRKQKEITVAVE